MNNIIKEIPELETLKDDNIFKKAFVGSGGYAVIWNDEMDIAGEELYINGVKDINKLKKD